jgi:hypothetical protein
VKRSTQRVLKSIGTVLFGSAAYLVVPSSAQAMIPPPNPNFALPQVVGSCIWHAKPGLISQPGLHANRMIAPDPGVSPRHPKSCR